MKCVICKEDFDGYGNNADPIAKGECCDACNIKVIQARLGIVQPKKLRVWHNSQFGNPALIISVDSIKEAKKILKTLADYDLYLGDLISDNAQGLEVYVGEQDYETNNGWEEWENEEGYGIDEVDEDGNEI